MRNLFLTLLVFTISSASSAQGLPDEINYPPYLKKVERLSDQISAAESDLSTTQRDLENQLSSRRQVQQDIYSTESQVEQANQNLRDFRNQLPILKREKRNSKIRLDDAKRELAQLNDDAYQTETKLNRAIRNNKPLRDEVNRLQESVRVIKDKIKTLTNSIQTKKTKVRSLDGQISNKQSAIISAQDQLTKLQQGAGPLKAQIAKLKQQVKKLTTEINSLTASIKKRTAQISQMQSKQKELLIRIRKLLANGGSKEEIAKLRRQVAQLKIKIQSQQKVLSNEKRSKQSKVAQRQQKNTKIAKIQTQINNLPTAIANLKRKIQRLKNELASLKSQKRTLNTQIANLKSQKSTQQNLLGPQEQKLAQKKLLLARKREIVKRLKSELNAILAETAEVEKDRKYYRSEVKRLRDEIEYAEAEIPRLTNYLRVAEQDLRRFRSELRQLNTLIENSQSRVVSLEREISSLVSQKSLADDQYRQRKNLYNSYLNEANDLGESQAQVANNLGFEKGKKDGRNKAVSLGNSTGSELGQSQANYWAYVRSEVDGHKNGREIGRKSSSQIKKAKELGSRNGKKAAYNYAEQTLRPKFFEQYYLDFLNDNKSSSADSSELLSHIKKDYSLIESVSNLVIQDKRGISPVSREEINASNDLKTSMDSSIQVKLSNLEAAQSKASFARIARNVFDGNQGIPYGKPKCYKVYKSISVFKKACEATYKDVFASIYKTNKFNGFKDIYESKVVEVQTKKAISRTEALYPSLYRKGFATAKTIGLEQGKKEIYDETYEQFYQSVYNAQLEIESDRVESIAKSEVNTWVNTNSAVTLSSFKVSKEKLTSGDKANLVFKLENVSNIASKKDIIIKITSFKNVTLSDPGTVVGVVAGNTSIVNESISFMVKSGLPRNTEISFSGQIILAGDKYKANRVEEFSFKKVLAGNIDMVSSVSYNRRPKARKNKTHTINILIQPKVEDIPEGFTLSLTALQNGQAIKFKTPTTLKTGPLKYAVQKKTTFSFRAYKSGRKKKVVLRLDYSYLGKVIKTENIEFTSK